MATEKRKKVICLVHFNPVEWYPPFMTALKYLESNELFDSVYAYSTKPIPGSYYFQRKSNHVKIYRFGWTGPLASLGKRLFTYLIFNTAVLVSLIRKKPDVVLYYETISCFAPIIYKRFFNSKAKLQVHYHEYMTKFEYAGGMKLVKFFHQLECNNYSRFECVSHTNQTRMNLFLSDNQGINFNRMAILPNYPSKYWTKPKVRRSIERSTVKLVYVGTLNFEGLYLKEVIEWVKRSNGRLTLDIFSILISDEIKAYLFSCDPSSIRYCGSVSFEELPSTLEKYDVGLVLYKGLTQNWQFNIPNKVFEYHRAGLDVWCPTDVLEVNSIKTAKTYPAIKLLDFSDLEKVDLDLLFDYELQDRLDFDFTAESVLDNYFK